MQIYTLLNAHPYLNILILKKHIRYNFRMEQYVDLYLYDQLEFAFLEKCQSVLRLQQFII